MNPFIYDMDLVRKESKKKLFSVVSLFAGCGGSSTGYRLAGGDVLAVNEFIESAQKCYEANYPETHIFKNDIRLLSGNDILNQIGLKKGELDILDGSPPCSSYSMAGKRERGWGEVKRYSRADNIYQSTDDLFFEFIRMIDELQPKVFVCENVKGLTQGLAKGLLGSSQYNIFDEQEDTIYHKMVSCGYNVRFDVLNARNYGVPQNRERTIFIGVRNDLESTITFPKKTSEDITLVKALDGLTISEDDKKDCWISETTNAYKLLVQMKAGDNASKYHPKGHYFSLIRLDFESVAGTLQASHATSNGCSHIHPVENRKLTIKELKRIMSFPDDFEVTGNFKQQWERLGRAVPPLMMKTIAEHIYQNIILKFKS
jgi:DNA (cytosine-5)-methyltransferase 1